MAKVSLAAFWIGTDPNDPRGAVPPDVFFNLPATANNGFTDNADFAFAFCCNYLSLQADIAVTYTSGTFTLPVAFSGARSVQWVIDNGGDETSIVMQSFIDWQFAFSADPDPSTSIVLFLQVKIDSYDALTELYGFSVNISGQVNGITMFDSNPGVGSGNAIECNILGHLVTLFTPAGSSATGSIDITAVAEWPYL